MNGQKVRVDSYSDSGISSQPGRSLSLSTITKRLLARLQQGYEVTIQSIYYVFILFIMLGLVYDFGNVGYAVSVARSAALSAAQDAGKQVDTGAFAGGQNVRLSDAAVARANQLVSGMTGGKAVVTSASVNNNGKHSVVGMTVKVTAKLPILNTVFGVGPLQIPIQTQAEAAFGIGKEGQ